MFILLFIIDIVITVGIWKAGIALFLKLLFTAVIYIGATFRMVALKNTKSMPVFMITSVVSIAISGFFIYYGLENAIKLVLFGSSIQTAVMLLLSAVNLIEKLIKKL